MAKIQQLQMMPETAYRLRVDNPTITEEDWFDLMLQSVTEAQVNLNWSFEYINELENEHHDCLAIQYAGAANRVIMFIDSLVSTMPIQLLRHTLHNMYMEDMEYTRYDSSLSFECNPVAHVGWRLVLPNINTNCVRHVRLSLPITGNELERADEI